MTRVVAPPDAFAADSTEPKLIAAKTGETEAGKKAMVDNTIAAITHAERSGVSNALCCFAYPRRPPEKIRKNFPCLCFLYTLFGI